MKNEYVYEVTTDGRPTSDAGKFDGISSKPGANRFFLKQQQAKLLFKKDMCFKIVNEFGHLKNSGNTRFGSLVLTKI